MKPMILYVIMALLLIIYFEILGQYLLKKFNCESRPFAFGYGFLLLMAFSYLAVSFVTVLHGSFYFVLFIYAAFVITSIVFVVRDFRKIRFKINPVYWAVLIFLIVLLTMYSYNTTLGDLNGFDSVSYMNYVSTNVGANQLDTIDVSYGGYVDSSFGRAYEFQGYYKFASVIVYLVSAAANIIHIPVLYSSVYIWVFQLLFTAFLLSIVLNGFDRYYKKKTVLNITIAFLLVFFFGKLYFNNALGFIGNCYRQIGFAFCSYELIDYLGEKTKTPVLFYMSLLGTCAFSSSSVFSVFFLLFALMFILVNKEKYIFRQYALVLLFPSINLLYVLTNRLVFSIVLSVLICTAMFVLNDLIVSLLKKKAVSIALIILVAALMAGLSYMNTGTIWNIDAFTDSLSERGDMTLNYFNLDFSYIELKLVYKILVNLSLVLYLLTYRKEPFGMMIWILILCVFNPLCIGYYATKNIVFYRTLDIVINPFTLFFFLNKIFEKINNRIISEVIPSVLLLCCIPGVSFSAPDYYHDNFVTYEGYDKVNKMSDTDMKAIEILKDIIYTNETDEPYIITVNRLTESVIPDGRYLYNRAYYASANWSNEEKRLYEIFYPREYGTEEFMKDADVSNIAELIEKAGIDYIVLKNDNLYYNLKTGTYYPLFAELNEYIYDNLYYYCEEFSVYSFVE